jgi:hypothetical protein
MPDRRSLLVAAAVYLGAVGLFAPLTYLVLNTVLDPLIPPGPLSLSVTLVTALVALWVAGEMATIRLHGFAALQRGPLPRRLARHLGLAVVAFAGFVVVASLSVGLLNVGLSEGRTLYAVLSAALFVVLLVVLARSGRAFVAGLRS